MTSISSQTQMLLALSMLPGIGPAALKRAVALGRDSLSSVENVAKSVPAVAKALLEEKAWNLALKTSEQQLEAAHKLDAFIVSALDENYPSLLTESKDDPGLLFVKGALPPQTQRSVAIIGTREPTEHGEIIAKRVTEFFVGEGWSIVSGLALGCDAIAHRSALSASGHTIAVLAHGLQTVAPTQHKRLAEEIVESGGALVTQYPFGRGAIPQQFVQRDKTQAALAEGVVMIQSDTKGGSLHASRASLSYGRWLAVPFPTDKDIRGHEPKIQANLLLAEGAASDQMDILRTNEKSDLARLFIIRSRDDYAGLTNLGKLGKTAEATPTVDDMF